MRTFEKTHPWIRFEADLQRLGAEFWIMLGECQSKCEHIAGVPLQPRIAQELHRVFLAKGVLATTAIEGNTLSEKEVLDHLEGKLKLSPSREYLAQEIDNIIKACNEILERVRSSQDIDLNVNRILQFNSTVLENLKVSEEVVPGALRTYSVGVGDYKAAPAEDCGYLLERLCDWLKSDFFQSKPTLRITQSIIKAVLAHLYIAWIHPFGDGNGRTARLLEFQILITSGVPSPAAHLLSNHYNQTRTEYYRQLKEASKSGGDILPFLKYAVQGFLDGLRGQLELIRGQQWQVTWHDFVHQLFRDQTSVSGLRKRHLVLDLSLQTDPVPINKLAEITPRIAKAYAGRTSKTLSRDLNKLTEMGLVEKTVEGYRARREIILAFLPVKVK